MDPSTKKLVEVGVGVGGKLAGDLIRLAFARPVKKKTEPVAATEYPLQAEALKKLGEHTVVILHDDGDVTVSARDKLYMVTTAGNVFEQVSPPAIESVTHVVPKQVTSIPLPTREETIMELKRRLYQEVYKAERDLTGGLVIAGKPCQCLEAKHTWEIEAEAKELIPEDPNNSVYLDIIEWIRLNQPKVITEAIVSGKYKHEYPQMAAQFRDFRKRIMSDEDWRAAKQQAIKDAKGLIVSEDITLEDAKKLAAEDAAEAVEKAWKIVEKNKLYIVTKGPERSVD